MLTLTPAERRAALVIAFLMALGAGRDLWKARHPDLARPPDGKARETDGAVFSEPHGNEPGAVLDQGDTAPRGHG